MNKTTLNAICALIFNSNIIRQWPDDLTPDEWLERIKRLCLDEQAVFDDETAAYAAALGKYDYPDWYSLVIIARKIWRSLP